MAYDTKPLKAMGGIVPEQSLNELLSADRTPHYNWVERLRLATDFVTPDNTLICIADHWLHDKVTNVTPIGLTQSFQLGESLQGNLAGEIGSRRKRAIIGSSNGGSISLQKLVVQGKSPINILSNYGDTLNIDSNYWSEKNWVASTGLNLDKIRTPMGIIVVEGDPAGRTYSAFMCEQCILQQQSRAYQAGSFAVYDSIILAYEQLVPLWDTTNVTDYTTTV